jgi:uncharacterized protein YyaL (SSP411 family)
MGCRLRLIPRDGRSLDGYYDDDSWWALAWIAAYDVSKNEEYLGLAIGIFEDLVRKIVRT